jgi:hypothetical protein
VAVIYKVWLEMASCGMICIPSFLKIGAGLPPILRFCSEILEAVMLVIPMRRFWKYAVEMDWDAMMYLSSFTKIGSGTQKLI